MIRVFLFAISLLGVGFVLTVFYRLSRSYLSKPWPFQPRKEILTSSEQMLLSRLQAALPEHLVFPKVPLSRFLVLPPGERQREWMERISQITVDFLVVTKDTKVFAVVELNDLSPKSVDQKFSDKKRDMALTSAGIRVFHWDVRSMPSSTAVQEAMFPATTPAADEIV